MKLNLFLNIGQKNNLLYSNFKSLNKKISKIGLGCVTFGREITEDESIRLLDLAVENGINLFNTSYYYGDGISEKIIGKFFKIKKNRKDITIVSKIHGDLSNKTIDKLLEKKIDLIIWTLNSMERLKELSKKNIQAIITDEVKEFADFLKRKN